MLRKFKAPAWGMPTIRVKRVHGTCASSHARGLDVSSLAHVSPGRRRAQGAVRDFYEEARTGQCVSMPLG